MAILMRFFDALSFLTILPAPHNQKRKPVDLGRSIAYFPIVGLGIGIILLLLYYILKLAFPLPLIGVLLVTALAILTGAHHLDGLIDVCDSLVAGKTKEQRLSIMSDTRIGTFGIVGVCLLLIVKSVVIANITGLAVLLVFPVISRWALCCLILIFPSAKTSGMGYLVKQTAHNSSLILATLAAVIISIVCLGLVAGILLMLTSLICLYLVGLIMNRLFGGLTGDCYGAEVEIGEVLIVLLSIAFAPLSLHFPWYNAFSFPFPQ